MKDIIATLVLATTAGTCVAADEPAPPLVDGRCSEYAALGAEPLALSPDVSLRVHQDRHFVWLCFEYPQGSFATLDMALATPSLVEPLNLHVSAQLGEWPIDNPELAPKNAESALWWNVDGWTANTLRVNGMDRSGDTPTLRFKHTPARELQLAKARFGRGTWALRMTLASVKMPDGRFVDVTFPHGDAHHVLDVF